MRGGVGLSLSNVLYPGVIRSECSVRDYVNSLGRELQGTNEDSILSLPQLT
jgi:hypothetical protein